VCGGDQPIGRATWICSVGAGAEAALPQVGHRRATPGAFAAAQALGLGCERAGRRGAGVEIDIGSVRLSAGRSAGVSCRENL
jgi:hypothetical protein